MNKPTAPFNSSNCAAYLYSIYNSIPVLQKTHYIKTDNGAWGSNSLLLRGSQEIHLQSL